MIIYNLYEKYKDIIISFTTALMLRVNTLSISFLEVLINFNGVFLAVMYMVKLADSLLGYFVSQVELN